MQANHQLNITLIAPVLAAAAAVSNPMMTSSCEKPNLWVMSGSQSIFFSSRRSRHVEYCTKQTLYNQCILLIYLIRYQEDLCTVDQEADTRSCNHVASMCPQLGMSLYWHGTASSVIRLEWHYARLSPMNGILNSACDSRSSSTNNRCCSKCVGNCMLCWDP